MLDRRRQDRSRSYLGGRIVFNHRQSSLDCLVRNISAGGAKLVFSDAVAVPEAFTLTIPKQDRELAVRLVWRRGHEAGIAMGETRDSDAPVSLAMARKLRDCEAERAILKRRLSEAEAVRDGA